MVVYPQHLYLITSFTYTASVDRLSNVRHLHSNRRIGASALEGDWPSRHVCEILIHLGGQRVLVAPQPLHDHVAFSAPCRGSLLLGDWLWRWPVHEKEIV